ncbi:MAG: hypothetical protein R2705_04135 [Ilumatobacteraceae bacterium]
MATGEGIEAEVAELHPIAEGRESSSGDPKGHGISVEPEERAIGSGFQEQSSVAGAAEGGVDERARRNLAKGGDDLVGHHRAVLEGIEFVPGHEVLVVIEATRPSAALRSAGATGISPR